MLKHPREEDGGGGALLADGPEDEADPVDTPEEVTPDEVPAPSACRAITGITPFALQEARLVCFEFKERTAALRILHGKGPSLSCHDLAILTRGWTFGRTKKNTSYCVFVDSHVLPKIQHYLRNARFSN